MRRFLYQRRAVLFFSIILLLELMLFVSKKSYFFNFESDKNEQKQIGTVSDLSGQARVRGVFDISWNSLKKGQSLFVGDEILTEENTVLDLRLEDGQNIKLDPKSYIIISQNRDSHKSAELVFVQKEFLEQVEKNLSIQTQEKTYILNKQPASIHVSTQAEKEIATLLPKKEIILKRPILLRPKIKQMQTEKQAPLDTPRLHKSFIKYPDEGTNYFKKNINIFSHFFIKTACAEEEKNGKKYQVELDWQNILGAKSYLLQISSQIDFKKMAFEIKIPLNHYVWETDIAGTYFWRVAALNQEEKQSNFSEFMKFAIIAARNNLEDETTFQSHLPFDDYSRLDNVLRILYGLNWTRYFFNPHDLSISPEVIGYNRTSITNVQIEYEYHLSSIMSLQFMLRQEKSILTKNHLTNTSLRIADSQDDIVLKAGIEKRIFKPEQYFFYQTGLRVSYIDIPVLYPGQIRIKLKNITFFGLYFLPGIAKAISTSTELSGNLGGALQYSGTDWRIGILSNIDLRRKFNTNMYFGFRLDLGQYFYFFYSDEINGYARLTAVRPLIFLEIRF